jgi:lysophospholipase L1-like esterase
MTQDHATPTDRQRRRRSRDGRRWIVIAATVFAALLPPLAAAAPPDEAVANPGLRVLAFGDSKIALSGFGKDGRNFTNLGFLPWVNRLLGGRFLTVVNAGVNGNDSQEMIARYGADVLARLDSYDFIWIDAGVNDIRHGLDPVRAADNLNRIVEDQVKRGKRVVWVLPPPVEFANPGAASGMEPSVAQARRAFAILRARVSAFAEDLKPNKNVLVVDPYPDLVDPSSPDGAMLAWASLFHDDLKVGDQIHPATPGALLAARRMAGAFATAFPDAMSPWSWPEGQFDPGASPRGNFLYNPRFLRPDGGGGGDGAVVTGAVPQSWTVSHEMGSWRPEDIVVTTEPAPAAQGGGNELVIEAKIPSGRSVSEILALRNALVLNDIGGGKPGGRLRAGVEIDLNDPAALSDIAIELKYKGLLHSQLVVADGEITGTKGSYAIAPGAKDRLFFETPPLVAPEAGWRDTLALTIRLQWNCAATAASGKIRIVRPWIAFVRD